MSNYIVSFIVNNYDDCVIIEFEDEEDDKNSLNFKNDNIKKQLAADFDGENDNIFVEEIEYEDDFLVVGCGSDDNIDGILNKPDEVATSCSSLVRAFVSRLDFSASNGGHQTWN